MTEREKDIEKIKAMKDGDTIYLRWFAEGGVQIHKYESRYFLFECLQYDSGPNSFEGCFDNIEKMIDVYEKWT